MTRTIAVAMIWVGLVLGLGLSWVWSLVGISQPIARALGLTAAVLFAAGAVLLDRAER